MAPVQRLWRLVWGGSLFTTEQWACSVHLHSATNPGTSAAAFKPALSTWMASSLIRNSVLSTLEFVKFNEIVPTTGRYLLPTSETSLVTPPVAGAANPEPAQLSLSTGLTTQLARGRGHAGRFYPPSGATAASLGNDGRITAGEAADHATASRTLINALNVVAAPAVVVVFSPIAQTVEVVTGVRVGRVWDTMRSRRSSLDEDYSTLPLA